MTLDAPEPVAARAAWDPARHPRDPATGKFVTAAAFADLVKKLAGERSGGFDHRLRDAASDGDALSAAPQGRYNGPPELGGALAGYVAGGYMGINGDLRKGDLSDPHVSQPVAVIDKAMESSRLTSDVKVFRGIHKPAKVFGAAWNDTDVSGLEWRDDGYTSTSTNLGTSGGHFADKGGAVMRILAPKGTRAVSVNDPKDPHGESELLLNRGTRFRIVADHGVVDGRRQLDVEVING